MDDQKVHWCLALHQVPLVLNKLSQTGGCLLRCSCCLLGLKLGDGKLSLNFLDLSFTCSILLFHLYHLVSCSLEAVLGDNLVLPQRSYRQRALISPPYPLFDRLSSNKCPEMVDAGSSIVYTVIGQVRNSMSWFSVRWFRVVIASLSFSTSIGRASWVWREIESLEEMKALVAKVILFVLSVNILCGSSFLLLNSILALRVCTTPAREGLVQIVNIRSHFGHCGTDVDWRTFATILFVSE